MSTFFMMPQGVVCLIATRPNINLLLNRALISIKQQHFTPTKIIIVFDQRPPTIEERNDIYSVLGEVSVEVLENQSLPGAAGSWNTGLAWAASRYPHEYLAIIDDDDRWDPEHLHVCWEVAKQNDWPDLVLSGLRIMKAGEQRNVTPVKNVSLDDFLVGNPGWQGSNTFIRIKAINQIGFTPGLLSCNDRDFAIRFLQNNRHSIAYTNCFTATWYCAERISALSAAGSPQKLSGLSAFYQRYYPLMTSQQKEQFFTRTLHLFNLTEEQITRHIREFE